MKKKTFLKSLSFTSLALLMGAAGVFAFAPLGANSNNLASANTWSNEINTKADGENIKYAPSPLGLDPENDPVIYTTESGLEIKYGGVDLNNSLASGKPLSGYPYFTMGTYNGYAVNWVIIGRNTNDTVFTSAMSSYLYSTWKTNNNVPSATFTTKAKYWFNGGGYETTTPAGSAIYGVVPSKSYVADVTKATKSVVGKNEVPSGYVLAISECVLGTATSEDTYTPGNLCKTIDAMYTSTLGISSTMKNLIKPMNLKTMTYLETFITISSKYFFPLAVSWGLTGDDFLIDTYLTTNALRISYNIGTTTATTYWTRTGDYGTNSQVLSIKSDGAPYPYTQGSSYGVRPSCVIKLG